MATEREKRDFGVVKKYGPNSIANKKIKPTHGDLIATRDGREIYLCENLPFALLNFKKSEFVRSGIYKKTELKVKYRQL